MLDNTPNQQSKFKTKKLSRNKWWNHVGIITKDNKIRLKT